MVDLPAPFGPIRAVSDPSGTARLASWTAATPPNDFDSPRTSRAGPSPRPLPPVFALAPAAGAGFPAAASGPGELLPLALPAVLAASGPGGPAAATATAGAVPPAGRGRGPRRPARPGQPALARSTPSSTAPQMPAGRERRN